MGVRPPAINPGRAAALICFGAILGGGAIFALGGGNFVLPCWIGGNWVTPATLPNYASALAAIVSLIIALTTLWIGQRNIRRIWRRESHFSACTLYAEAFKAVNHIDIDCVQDDDSLEAFQHSRETFEDALKILNSVEEECRRVPESVQPFRNLMALVEEAETHLAAFLNQEKRGQQDIDNISPEIMRSVLETAKVNIDKALSELCTATKPYRKRL
ncbi:hypothetical protein CKO38_07940 [Rhodospirillum rubrum]|uniref:hypothetical protein n=1 Tax=Rhodospirillum rubrum TaxID=1085 RepID=UPI001908AC11|nr:hypothetical protein [Rhodospirillum rubrum]MBK1663949.1 hypothetical protein [Rhodospirillum rubrum]MBK1676601.1 hypothetical protein [Rhodospirillum rubrum]